MLGLRFFRPAKYTLAAQWRALATMALAKLRFIARLEKNSPRKALRQAALLEAWLICALTALAHQIERDDRKVHMEKPFNEQLPPLAAIFLHMYNYLQRLTQRLKAGLNCAVLSPLTDDGDTCLARHCRAWSLAPPYLDSG